MAIINSPDGDDQWLTNFPDNMSKRVDYVITYTYKDEPPSGVESDEDVRFKKDMRELFFQRLNADHIDTYPIDIRLNDGTHKVYVLLHCQTERLFDEAQRVNLQMRLNNVTSLVQYYSTNTF